MWFVFLRNFAALVALFIFVMGNGFFSTFIASVLTHRGTSSMEIGLMSSCFYAGLMLGAFRIEKLIARVYHIRAYAAFASALTVIALLHGIFDSTFIWFVLRFLGGIATAGVFVVVESWLLSQSTLKTRGQMLSVYMITFYAAQSLGQLLLGLYDKNDLLMFVIIAMCCSLSVIPMAVTKAETPKYSEPSTLKIRHLFQLCASGLLGSLIAGLVLGVIYGLFPVYFTYQFHDPDRVARLMFIIIFGGMLLQYPVGRLSDVYERRLILLITSIASIVVLIFMAMFAESFLITALLSAVFGGLTFTLYPVSISYACDSLDTEDIVAGTQTLLLTYSVGAMSGPVIAPLFMHSMTHLGLFAYFIFFLGLLCIFLSWRKTIKISTPHEETFIAFPQNTPIGCEADPRGEPSIDTSLTNDSPSP